MSEPQPIYGRYYPVTPSTLWQIRKAAHELEAAVQPVRDVFPPKGYTDEHERLAAVVSQLQAAWANLIDPLACVLYEAAVGQQLEGDEAAGVTVGNETFSARIYEVERPYGVGENGR